MIEKMEKKKVLCVIPMTEKHRDKLENSVSGYQFIYKNVKDVRSDDVKDVSIIAGSIPPELLECAGQLEWLQLPSAGYDKYVKEGVLPNGVKLTCSVGAYGPAVSEHMLAMVLALQKRLHTYSQNMLSCKWQDAGNVTSVNGSRTLVIGLGNIGQEFASKMKVLGSHVTGIRRNISEKPDCVEAVCSMDQLDSLLPEMDIVAVVMPGSPENYHLFSEEKFSRMKKGSIFINAGRGSLVDEKALLKALKEGPLGSAGLDVSDPEPMCPDNPLWKQENILITPHTAGGFHLPETMDRIVDIFIENLQNYKEDRPLRNLVKF